jgi:hypothetical protein
MKFKYKSILKVKVGDTLVYPDELPSRIVNITKSRGQFMSGDCYRVYTNNSLIGSFTAYGVHWYEGKRYPADELPIAVD